MLREPTGSPVAKIALDDLTENIPRTLVKLGKPACGVSGRSDRGGPRMLLTTEPNLSLSGDGYKQALVLRVAQKKLPRNYPGPPVTASDYQGSTKGLAAAVRPPTSTASHHYHDFRGFPMRQAAVRLG